MTQHEDIQRLKRRYHLRDEGREMANMYLDESFRRSLSELDIVCNSFTGVDRLHFRQGFLFELAKEQ